MAKLTKRTILAIEEGTLVCTVCKERKPTSEYYWRSDGNIRARCKECEHAAQKKFREENKEHVQQQKKSYNALRKPQIDAYNHMYAVTHSKQNVQRVKEWNKENPERARELFRQRCQRRIARKKQLASTFTMQEWNDCLAYFEERCAYCGTESMLTQDHVIPVSKGGPYTQENIIPACGSCNSRRGNKDIWVWFRTQSFYSKEREDKIRLYLTIKHANTEGAVISGPCNA